MNRFLSSIVLATICARAAVAAEVAENRGWVAYGGTPGGGHYSALSQIDRGNVGKLRQAWTHSTGDAAINMSEGRNVSYEVTPIFANDHLYLCTTRHRVVALDPATGKETWVFDPHASLIKEPVRPGMCRGVAYWEAKDPVAGAPCQKRIFKGDNVSRMFAVDADTGKACEDFGAGGYIDLSTAENGGDGRLIMTSPQATLPEALIIGGSVGDNIAANSPDGRVRALDPRTGALLWVLPLVPPELHDRTGGADVWPPFSVDPDTNMIYVGTGSPSTDFYGVNRTADIPYANAVMAIDGATGAVKWHRQLVHHDLFDYDMPDQPHLVDIVKDGVKIPAVVQMTKMGTVFAFHRDTGEPIYPIEERPVPKSDIAGEQASPTQPFPAVLPPFSAQELKEDELFGLTPWDRGKCREAFNAHRYEGPFTPASEKGSLIFPSPGGGGNWGGAAYDPARNLLVLKAQNFVFTIQLVPAKDGDAQGTTSMARAMTGTPYRTNGGRLMSPWGVPCNPPPWGELVAMDLSKGTIAWRRPVGQVPFGPFGLLKSPAKWGSPVLGGPIVTGGGLIFMAGTMESVFRAFDVDSGKELWADDLPVPGMSVPMTYEFKGRQYVVIAAGGSTLAGTELGDRLIAYALP